MASKKVREGPLLVCHVSVELGEECGLASWRCCTQAEKDGSEGAVDAPCVIQPVFKENSSHVLGFTA